MKRRQTWKPLGLMLIVSVAACSGANRINQGPPPSVDPFIGILNKGIMQLDININGLSKRMNEVQQAPAGGNPLLQELQALNMSGWQLHQQQWVVQRDHLVLARDLLQQADKSRGDQTNLLGQWRRHTQDYTKAVEDLRQQRQSLERKHLDVEARLVEQKLSENRP